MSTISYNDTMVKCAECGTVSPASAEACWSCEEKFTHRTRWRVGCYYCSKTMDFMWAGSKPIRKHELDYMICSPEGEECDPDGESTFITTFGAVTEVN